VVSFSWKVTYNKDKRKKGKRVEKERKKTREKGGGSRG